jgi:hypothetical protein
MLRVMTIVFCTITNFAVLARLITRYCLHQSYRLDDYCIIVAAVSCLLFDESHCSSPFVLQATDATFTAIGVQCK